MDAGQQGGAIRMALEGELTIYSALQAKQSLLDGLARGSGLEADLSHVTEFDAAGLQLLLLARAEAERVGKPFRLVGFSPAVEDVLRLCRLTDWLDESYLAATH